MKQLNEQYQQYCAHYLANLHAQNKLIKTNTDTAKARDRLLSEKPKKRAYTLHRTRIKSPGIDVIASPQLDNAVIKAFSQIPKPGKKYLYEDNFLIFNRSGILASSNVFQMPENGGRLNYSCHLGYRVDWTTVMAAAHTHPLYGDRALNKLNKYFSAGDPTILFFREIPLYLRTPKGDEIKVLEIRNNWVTTRRVDKAGSEAKTWKMRG